jgi:PKD repeat protein
MFNFVRLYCQLMLFVALALLPVGAIAQIFTGEPLPMEPPADVKQILTAWNIYRLPAGEMQQYANSPSEAGPMQVHLGAHHWKLQLQPSNILSPGYTLQVSSDQGVERHSFSEHIAFKGTELSGGGRVRLTMDENFIHGFVEENGERYYIEPLWYHDRTAEPDLFLVYPSSAVIYDPTVTCMELAANESMPNVEERLKKELEEAPEFMACYELEMAIASDNSMFNKYGSVSGVEAHNIAVLNDVQGNYTGSFNHDINLVIVTQFVVTGSDPWTSSTNASTLLSSFTTWGNSGGFGVPFDNGELWTNRNFDGSTIGIAWLGGICNSNKYHCLQDFSTNADFLRVLTAHELGHNFNASHDAPNSGFIMAPAVNNTNSWSGPSTTAISNYITVKVNSGCLGPCGSSTPLVASFTWSPTTPCEGQTVQFTDMSTGNITSRSWAFQNGTPSTSTQTNPSVTWNTAGAFNVTLTLNGTGGPVSTTQTITILPKPTANFTYTYDDLTYTFASTSTNAISYSWSFGDGGTSNEENPVYTYASSGFYTVILTVENDCGTASKSYFINTVPTADFTASPTSGCTPLTVQFSNQSSFNATAFSWQFPGAVQAFSNIPNPITTYTTPGVYTVTLTVSNASGTSVMTKTNLITVLTTPTANFSFGVNGQTVTFSNSSAGATSYLWNFGDGNTSTLSNPAHTYAAGGVYTVTLTSTNVCGSDIAEQTVSLLAPPTASFTANTTSGCSPLTVNFTNTTTGSATSYSWSFPGGTPGSSTDPNPTVVYNTAGTYTVTLTATNATGSNTSTQNSYITVQTTPVAGFTSSSNGFTAIFTNTSTGAVSSNWNFGDGGTSTDPNPVHTYAADGTYTVTLTVTNPCGTHTSTQTVVIITPPTAGFTASPTSGCGPLTVQFTNTSTANATNFSWDFPGGSPAGSSEQNPTVVYGMAGTYTVTLTVSNAAGSSSTTQTSYITVNPGPTAGFTSAVNGSSATFTNTSANAVSYSWNFGDGNSSAQQNPSHTYANDGTYTVTLTATNPCGIHTATQTLVIATPPTAGFTATPVTGCGPLSVQFTSTSSANSASFNWTFPGGTPGNSTAQNPVVVYYTPGIYSVTLTVSNTAGSNTATQTNYVTVNAGPTAGFTSAVNGNTATFANSSTNAVSYAWNFGDGNSSTLQNPSHVYTNDGTYTVTLTATNPLRDKQLHANSNRRDAAHRRFQRHPHIRLRTAYSTVHQYLLCQCNQLQLGFPGWRTLLQFGAASGSHLRCARHVHGHADR